MQRQGAFYLDSQRCFRLQGLQVLLAEVPTEADDVLQLDPFGRRPQN